MTIEVWLGGERPVFRWSVATEDSNALLAGNRNVQHWEHRAVHQGIDMHSINRSSEIDLRTPGTRRRAHSGAAQRQPCSSWHMA